MPNLIISLARAGNTDTAQVIGREADEGEQLTCEGCGELLKRLYEDDDMNMLCTACIALLA